MMLLKRAHVHSQVVAKDPTIRRYRHLQIATVYQVFNLIEAVAHEENVIRVYVLIRMK